jgi:hypothetical protein
LLQSCLKRSCIKHSRRHMPLLLLLLLLPL